MSQLETSWDLWAWLVLATGLLASGQLALARRRGRGGGESRRLGASRRALLLGAGVGCLLVLAVLDPRWVGRTAPSHLVVVLDVSRSVLRSAESWPALRAALVDDLRRRIDALPATARRSRASLVLVADGTRRVVTDVAPDAMVRALATLEAADLPPSGASRLGQGLAEAAAIHQGSGGRGAVLLVSDGHIVGEGDDVALGVARQLAAWGLPIHGLPRGASEPELGLFAVDLPARLAVDEESRLRAVLFNQTGREQSFQLRRRVDDQDEIRHDIVLAASSGWTTAELPYRCTEGGIHAVELEALDPSSGAEPRSRRQLLIHCVAPPRILLVGHDPALATLFEPVFEVETRTPGAFAGVDPAEYDAVVLHGVRADRLDPDGLVALAAAVEGGTGLLVMNGRHLGGPEAATVLMSYEDSPLADLLPLESGQRPLHLPAPPLTIFVLVDSSGSMAGWHLDKAKAIGFALIDRLRPIDTLYLMGFTGGVSKLVWGERMNGEGRDLAKRRLAALQAGGGTDPRAALRELDSFRLRDCGLFVLSDGGFAPARARPGCEGTAFAIGVSRVPTTLVEQAPNAEPILVSSPGFDVEGLKLSFFEPPPRKRRFEPGRFVPLTAPDAIDRGWRPLPDEPAVLRGNALTHRRDESTRLMIERPRPRDPVLAYRDHGAGRVGELTSPLSEGYLRGAGAEVPRRWVEELLPYTAQRRFEVAVEPAGRGWELRVTLLEVGGKTPRVDWLTARLEAGGVGREVALRGDPELPGVFYGRLEPPGPGRAFLVLREVAGPDAERRDQRIRWHVPATRPPVAAPTAEDGDFGLDHDLLSRLAAAGRGRLPAADPLLVGPVAGRTASLAPWCIVLALIFYMAQIAERHFRRPGEGA